MKRLRAFSWVFATLLTLGSNLSAGLLFPDPPGGWSYFFNGDAREPGGGADFDALDGTWSHTNGSDEWDGSDIGGTFGPGNSPGGISVFTDGGISYLRIQDTGDPRDFGYSDPGSNRKIYLGHDLSANGATDTQMDDGFTLTFRARIPTGGTIDPLHRDGQGAAGVQPYPATGDGYVTSDSGKGNFVVRQAAGGAIAFSLTTATDTPGGNPDSNRANFTGLTMNEFAGNQVSGSVNFGQGTGTNVIAFDPTQWHEFWIVLRKDPANVGTHQAYIYMDGSFEPTVFKVTAGTGNDYAQSYIAIGSTATPQNSALDVDFVAYKLGVHFPGNALDSLPPEIADVSPAQNATFQSAAQGVRFSASTQGGNSLPPEGFLLELNGEDVSSGVTVSGSPQARQAVYTGLQANTVYTGQIIVRDQAGRGSTNRLSFDTFTRAGAVVIEAEDYNFSGGSFVDNPVVWGLAEQLGLAGTDYLDTVEFANGNSVYRSGDPVGTANTTDYLREEFANSGLPDVHVDEINAGEWLNYTRTLPAGRYHIHVRAGSAGAQPLRIDRVTGDRTQPNQATAQIGSIRLPNTGTPNAFAYGTLSDVLGRPLAVGLSGVTTLRLTAPTAANNLNINYIVLAPATGAAEPQVTASPGPGATGVSPAVTLRALVYDGASPIAPGSVKLALDGNDVTGGSSIVDTPEGVSVTHKPAAPLTRDAVHTVRIEYAGGSVEWSFTTANPPLIPGSYATAPGSGRNAGINVQIHAGRQDADIALFQTTNARAEDQLAGRLIDPATSQPFANEAAGANNGRLIETSGINYSQLADGVGAFVDDKPFPNLDPFDWNHIALAGTAYLELPVGVYRMGVRSDDGFRVSVGTTFDTPELRLGEFEGGRGTAATEFEFLVERSGVYAFRLVYYEGNGGADVEWYTTDLETGVSHLVGGPTAGAIRAYTAREGSPVTNPPDASLSARVDGSDVILSWPKTSPAYRLETSPTQIPPSWGPAAGTPTEDNGTLTLRVPATGAGALYRLNHP